MANMSQPRLYRRRRRRDTTLHRVFIMVAVELLATNVHTAPLNQPPFEYCCCHWLIWTPTTCLHRATSESFL